VNFLAHLHLADPDPGLMLGGIVADFIRNPEVGALPKRVQDGVQLHRLIDGFTDRHPLVHRSVSRIGEKMGWFASIVIDIYYDHVLARTWATYSTEPLRLFASRCYNILASQSTIVPSDAQRFLQRFIERDHIGQYLTVDGIAITLARVSASLAKRIPRRAIWLPDALPLLVAADSQIAADFAGFYPELIAFVAEQRLGIKAH
jgi:acyl carrier protein phosphodiesterase